MNRHRKVARHVALYTTAVGISLSGSGCSEIVHAGDYTTLECTVNADCITAHGSNWLCRKSDHTCQGLINDDCQTVIGGENLRDENTLLWGALFALNGPNAAIGKAELTALQMAYSDIKTSANGLPPLPGQTQRRQIAVLVCDDSATNDIALRSTQHMISLGIQGMTGPSWSGPTINLITKASLPAGMFVLGCGTTSPDITTLAKGGPPPLYFRTVESTAFEGPAISKVAEGIEAAVHEQQKIDKVKVAVVYKGDSFGKGTALVIIQNLHINGALATDPTNQENFLQLDYGNPADTTTDPLKYDDTAAKVAQFQPDIVIASGTNEANVNVMSGVEQKWTGATRPYWIYTHSQVNASTVNQLNSSDPDGSLRRRVLGVTVGSNTPTFNSYVSNWIGTQPPDISPFSIFANTTYDAFYALNFAAVSLGTTPVTGVNLSHAMKNLITGPEIHVGPPDLGQAFSTLSGGSPINMTGTSGPMDFDLNTGDVKQENQVWCVPTDKAGKAAFPIFSGYGFDLNQNATGQLSDLNDKCGVQFATR
jgi:branched-chain amino acid transport system substrate-binding protein